MTTGSLWLLHATTPSPGRFTEMAVLTLANLFVTVMRFVAMRLWVFVRQPPPHEERAETNRRRGTGWVAQQRPTRASG